MKKNYTIKDGVASIRIKKSIYPKEVLMQAAYVKIEDFYILLDEEEEYFEIELRLKSKEKDEEKVEEGILTFFDELIEAQNYLDQMKRTTGIRELILERALLTQEELKKLNEKED
jgi:His-Xaa-Ser system protein HxsD